MRLKSEQLPELVNQQSDDNQFSPTDGFVVPNNFNTQTVIRPNTDYREHQVANTQELYRYDDAVILPAHAQIPQPQNHYYGNSTLMPGESGAYVENRQVVPTNWGAMQQPLAPVNNQQNVPVVEQGVEPVTGGLPQMGYNNYQEDYNSPTSIVLPALVHNGSSSPAATSEEPVFQPLNQESGNLGAPSSPVSQSQMQHTIPINKMSREYINNLMPRQIASEFRMEKLRTFIMFVIGFFGSLASGFFIFVYFYAGAHHLSTFLGMDTGVVPHPFITICVLVVTLALFFSSVFNFARIRLETTRYLQNIHLGTDKPPMFLIDNYKKMVVRRIVINWVACVIYIFGGITLGILYGFQAHTGQHFNFAFWSLGKVKDLTAEITITIIVLIATFAIHVLNLVVTHKRISSLRSYYGYEIVPVEEIVSLKHRTNKICVIIFLIIIIVITLVIVIPWWLARKGKWKWPWKRG